MKKIIVALLICFSGVTSAQTMTAPSTAQFIRAETQFVDLLVHEYQEFASEHSAEIVLDLNGEDVERQTLVSEMNEFLDLLGRFKHSNLTVGKLQPSTSRRFLELFGRMYQANEALDANKNLELASFFENVIPSQSEGILSSKYGRDAGGYGIQDVEKMKVGTIAEHVEAFGSIRNTYLNMAFIASSREAGAFTIEFTHLFRKNLVEFLHSSADFQDFNDADVTQFFDDLLKGNGKFKELHKTVEGVCYQNSEATPEQNQHLQDHMRKAIKIETAVIALAAGIPLELSEVKVSQERVRALREIAGERIHNRSYRLKVLDVIRGLRF